jgi:hypothetical protein
VAGPPPADVDVLVIGEPSRADVYDSAEQAEQRVGFPVNVTLSSPARWAAAPDALIQQIRSALLSEYLNHPPTATRIRLGTGSRRASSASSKNAASNASRAPKPTARHGPAAPGTPSPPHASSSRRNPDSAFVLAYDAARQACTALLAQQGPRPTTSGSHYAVEESVRAQFGTILRPFGALRRRRNELEYPLDPADRASATEAADGIQTATELIDAAAKILPNLGIF